MTKTILTQYVFFFIPALDCTILLASRSSSLALPYRYPAVCTHTCTTTTGTVDLATVVVVTSVARQVCIPGKVQYVYTRYTRVWTAPSAPPAAAPNRGCRNASRWSSRLVEFGDPGPNRSELASASTERAHQNQDQNPNPPEDAESVTGVTVTSH